MPIKKMKPTSSQAMRIRGAFRDLRMITKGLAFQGRYGSYPVAIILDQLESEIDLGPRAAACLAHRKEAKR